MNKTNPGYASNTCLAGVAPGKQTLRYKLDEIPTAIRIEGDDALNP
jgi:hypothetical protein